MSFRVGLLVRDRFLVFQVYFYRLRSDQITSCNRVSVTGSSPTPCMFDQFLWTTRSPLCSSSTASWAHC